MDFAQAEKQAQNLLSSVKEVRENPRHPIAYNQAALTTMLKDLRQADDALKLLTTSDEQHDLEFMDNEDKMEVDDEEEEGYGDLVGKASCYVINEKAELKAAKTSEERRRAVVKFGEVSQRFASEVIGCLDHALQSDESVVIEERYLCPFGCKGDGYSSKTALVNHLKEKHPIGEVELFDCGECDKKGMTKKQLANHKPVHKKVECPYKCLDGCNAKPMTKSNVNRHCELKHPNRIKKSKAKKKKV